MVPKDMDFDVTFGNRAQGQLQKLGGGHFRLNAMLLPYQAVRITWWKKSDSEQWKLETNNGHSETKVDQESL